VTTETESTRFRNYLLGRLTDAEAAALEEEYFRDEHGVDHLTAVEDELIDEHLAGGLSRDDRRRFESVYLATSRHRRRAEIVRQLKAAASRDGRVETQSTGE
jgi:hypothetical protein